VQFFHLTDRLKFIQNHFSGLPKIITYFENQNISLREGISKLDGTLNSLKSTPGEFGSRLQQKINLVLAKNPNLHIVKQISLGIFENQQLKSKYAFSLETFGPWSPDAKELFKDISKLLLEKSGVSESPSYFQQRISIAVQRGNAASVLGTVAKSSGLEEVFYLFKI
jgi:hypothetical protein